MAHDCAKAYRPMKAIAASGEGYRIWPTITASKLTSKKPDERCGFCYLAPLFGNLELGMMNARYFRVIGHQLPPARAAGHFS